MVTNFQTLKNGKCIAEIIAMICDTPLVYIEKAKQIYESYDECADLMNTLQKYMISDPISICCSGAASNTSNSNFVGPYKIEKYDTIRIKCGKKFKWAVVLNGICDGTHKCIYAFKKIDSLNVMIWDDNRKVNMEHHKKSCWSGSYLGDINDTEGHIRFTKIEENGKEELYGDWYSSYFTNISYGTNSSIWVGKKCVWGSMVLMDYLKTLNRAVNTWDDIIVGEEYEIDSEIANYVIDNYWDTAFYYDACVKTSMRHIKKITVLNKKKKNRNEIQDMQLISCFKESGKSAGFSGNIDLLPCMLKKKDAYVFSDEEKKILNDLIEKKRMFIEYRVYNGGGEGRYYELNKDNTILVKGVKLTHRAKITKIGENCISLPWGRITISEAKHLLDGTKDIIKHGYLKNEDGEVSSTYALNTDKDPYSYGAERP